MGRPETFKPAFVDTTSTVLSPPFPAFQTFGRTKDRRSGGGRDCPPDWHPRAAGNTADQFLRLLVLWSWPSGSYLLKVTDGVEKLSRDLQIGTHPPVKEKEQQGDKSN